jgi:predicted glycogen debranching enzyme
MPRHRRRLRLIQRRFERREEVHMNQHTTAPQPEGIVLGRALCGDLTQAERREWWLANGLGAYASGTVAGTLTRRYHGLLIAPVNPPLGRHLVFAKADATATDGKREWPLHANRWAGGTISPRGYVHLESFRLQGRMPVWRFACGDALIEQRIWMEPGAHSTYVAFRLQPLLPGEVPPWRLRVRLLINARDHHSNTRPGDFSPSIEGEGLTLKVTHPGGFSVYFKIPSGRPRMQYTWVENFDLPAERERGLDADDAHLCIAELAIELKEAEWVGLVASLEAQAPPDVTAAMRRFERHDATVLARAREHDRALADAPPWVAQLVLAADSFVFARPLPEVPEGESVVAGYPWFGDWGRDTMIALPGLTLATGRYQSARRILVTFARYVDQGMLPNFFAGTGKQPKYNTADGALWYLEAWRAYVDASGDRAALARTFPLLESIIDWHRHGTRYGIGMDRVDGLLRAGEPGAQLTWMDAKIGDLAVTSRIGKPVEINALWFNALCVMAEFATMFERDAGPYERLAEQVRRGFQRFVTAGGGLKDVLDGPGGDDVSVRPNQIFAVSLPHSPLTPNAQRGVVAQCARELLGSYGLRSLATLHPDYRGRYQGGVWERDSAYHQGPLWAWLLGHFALAYYRAFGDAKAAQSLLEPIGDHLADAGLGTVSEIFDGDPPHTPRGAPAQAWSVACVLEAWTRLARVAQCPTAPPAIWTKWAPDRGLKIGHSSSFERYTEFRDITIV